MSVFVQQQKHGLIKFPRYVLRKIRIKFCKVEHPQITLLMGAILNYQIKITQTFSYKPLNIEVSLGKAYNKYDTKQECAK